MILSDILLQDRESQVEAIQGTFESAKRPVCVFIRLYKLTNKVNLACNCNHVVTTCPKNLIFVLTLIFSRFIVIRVNVASSLSMFCQYFPTFRYNSLCSRCDV